MKRVGRWTWMLLTLLLLLCTTAFAKTIECGSIELEQPVEVTIEDDNMLRYILTFPVSGMRVTVEWLSENENDARLYLNNKSVSSTGGIFTLNKENTIKLCAAPAAELPVTVRFALHEYRNDEQEPNDVIPTELHDGDSVKFVLDRGDKDCFTIKTEKPGQDIALTFGGFNYADKTKFNLNWDKTEYLISKNGTAFFHATEPGVYGFSLSITNESKDVSRSMEVHLLDGDENELNDTKETATPLPIGTDAAFSIGGINDEDWFSFEAVPEEGKSKLYTLRLLDFDFENPESVCYEIYAPDGTVAVSETAVSSRHTRVFSCSQQGQYAVRLYLKYVYNSSKYHASIQRAALRIRVEEGGDDPYESNDTWLDAAYIEPGQLISHVLPSGDADWFCFTVPEDHMTLHVSSDCAGIMSAVFSGQTLAEDGDSANEIWHKDGYGLIAKSASNLYWKLGEKGLYYIKLFGGSSEKIYSTTISLIPPEAIEDNDVWYRATPLYEEVTQAFDISAPNDPDWFCFTVPEGSGKTLLLDVAKTDTGRQQDRVDFYLYREAYFSGQDDSNICSGFVYTTTQPYSERFSCNLEPGTYYLSLENNSSSISRIQELSICYKLVPQLDNDTIATAAPLTERVWQDVWQAGYFSIGERKAGEVVQIQYDNRGSKPKEFIHVYDADGKEISSSYRANLNFRIPTDGVYYLKAPECDVNVNAENEPMHLAHIRYYTHNDKIGAVESVTMRPNESVFLDLWFSPDVSFSDKSEAENLTYNWSTGYLTAPNTPEGSADLVFSNGYPEGDERRIEAVVHVTWSEKLLSDISISNAPQSLTIGSSAMLEANVDSDSYVKYVSWESSDTSVLRVLSNGKVVAV